MIFGSACSGIEAASVAWGPLGWRAAWFSEIDPFPCAVLAHHYPGVPNHGDMTCLPGLIRTGAVESPDLFCGGTPCQAFSVAGLRRSLDDARGNLSLTFVEIADAIDDVRRARGDAECIVVWENVPGVLSTKDNAFGCFIGALAGCDTAIEPLAATGWTDAGVVAGPVRTVAWRILDAQYFSLAQRRKRVFVVASARGGFDPAAVLFEWDGVRRDSAPSREAGKATAGGAASGAGGSRHSSHWNGGVHPPLSQASQTRGGGIGGSNQEIFEQGGAGLVPATVGALTAACGPRGHGGSGLATDKGAEAGHIILAFGGNRTSGAIEVTPALLAQPGSGWKGDFESETFVVAHALTASRSSTQCPNEDATLVPVLSNDPATAICANEQRTYTNEGSVFQLRNLVGQPLAFQPRIARNGRGNMGELVNALQAQSGKTGKGDAAPCVAVAFDTYNQDLNEHVTHALRDGNSEGTPAVLSAMQVRRLTPRECERLQGFPDDYTSIPWRGKPADQCPDGPRYKALGNSWAVPVVRWVGARINFVAGMSLSEVA